MPAIKYSNSATHLYMIQSHPPKVIVGLSGGVDSSVAALLLQQQGYVVEGLYMKNWNEDDAAFCPHEQDLKDVRSVCQKLGIRLHTVSFAEEYWQRVFSHFLEDYQNGRTPNPDILCNQEIKFKECLSYALKLGADYFATGHYAKISTSDGLFSLQEAFDGNKDQSYFLYTLDQFKLSKSLFPLADLSKPQVRELAEKHDLITHNKKDSTGICFIGERPFNSFLNEFLKGTPGTIETPEGQKLGEHAGLIFFTLGQRKGLHIGGVKTGKALPWYVVAKDLARNVLIVAQENDHPLNLSSTLWGAHLHWITGQSPQRLRCQARIRYRQPRQDCLLEQGPNGYKVTFDAPQIAVTPGQAIVFYDKNQCLGGAIIETTDSLGGILKTQQGSLDHGIVAQPLSS